MTEALPPNPEAKAADVLSGWWRARAISEDAAGHYFDAVARPIVQSDADTGVRILRGFAESDHLDARLTCASCITLLTPEVPKEDFLTLVRDVLYRDEPGVQGLMLEALFQDEMRGDVSWLDMRDLIEGFVDKPYERYEDPDHGVPGSSVPPLNS